MKRKGISLIVLVITIVVVIILAVSVILTLSKNNPIGAANEATFKNDLKNYQYELQLFIAKQRMEDHGYNLTKLNADETEASHIKKGNFELIKGNINGVITSMKEEHSKILEVSKGKLVIKGNATEREIGWANDVGIKKVEEKATIPSDWPDIRDDAPENGISLLVSKGTMSFDCTVNTGKFNIDWGDGTQESHSLNNSVSHTYTGDQKYEIKIYPESGNKITEFSMAKGPLLMCYLNCDTLMSTRFMFSNVPLMQVFDVYDKSATKNITEMGDMFHACSSLKSIPEMDTSSVIEMDGMFYNCSSLVNIPRLDTSNVTNMYEIFSGCSKLTSIPKLKTSNVTDMHSMFKYCSELVIIQQLDISNVFDMDSIFYNCSKLTNIVVKNTAASTELINELLTALPDRSSKTSGTIDLTQNTVQGYTESIATSKNWTIVK